MNEGDRMLLRTAALDLSDRARRLRGDLALDAPERHFLLGVEAAAQEVLHPELTMSRADDWLSRERGEFRDGYFKTRTALADALTGDRQVTSIPIPH